MTYDAVKVEKLSKVALGLLQREIALASRITVRSGEEFVGALGDAISIKVGARTKSKSRALRPATEQARTIQFSDLTEQKVIVEIDEDIYNAVGVEDEIMRLDIENFATQVLAPQIRAVAIGFENKIANEISGANYVYDEEFDPDRPYDSLVKANGFLGEAFVPMEGRTLLVGAGVETALLLSDQLHKYDSSGDASALKTATLGQIAGYTVIKSYALPANEAYLIHKSAFSAAWLAPVVPSGASFGKSVGAPGGVSLTWLQDYDFLQSRDRSLVHVYAGTNTTVDKPDVNADNALVAAGGLLRAAKLTLPDAS